MAAELDELIARLRNLPRIVEDVLPEAATELAKIIAGNIAAQRGPDGVPWPAPKDPETKAVLLNAMKSVTVSAIGRVLLTRVDGPEARHHLGIAKGKVKREIIPTKKIPTPMVEALRRVLLRKLDKAVRGG